MDEFDLIHRWFDWHPQSHPYVTCGIGDDASVLHLAPLLKMNAPHHKLRQIISTDTFILGVHCPKETAPKAIGHKALAVNLSDIAAMGATPAWFTLAITLPDYNESWLHNFVMGMKALAEEHQVALIGGDTTRGNLSISITIGGYVSVDHLLLRSTAKTGDLIYVTGVLGQGGLGLLSWKNNQSDQFPNARYHLDYPQPRVAEGKILSQFASSCIDLSDGLLADLGHLCKRSALGSLIDVDKIPLSNELLSIPKQNAYQLALTGGDDYELLYTVSPESEKVMNLAMKKAGFECYCIGRMEDSIDSVQLKSVDPIDIVPCGYNHFK